MPFYNVHLGSNYNKTSRKFVEKYDDNDGACADCVAEDYLSREISKLGKQRKCAFCGQRTRTYTILEITDRVEEVLLTHYERTPDQPSEMEYYMQHADKESTYVWYREGQTVVDLLINEFEIEDALASEIAERLALNYSDFEAHSMGEETEFDSEAQYEIRGVNEERWTKQWKRYEDILKSEARFFSIEVAGHLKSIFDGIHNVRTWSGKPVYTTIGPSAEIDSLYRARVFQSPKRVLEALCSPDRLLGSPPSFFAMSGRMNARGISVFYGATEQRVALAEVRPPVGSKVAVARFEIIRPLQVLDLRVFSHISETVSVFDPQYLDKMEKAAFLKKLGGRMTAPVMPDDEIFDYLPTQVIADYLAAQNDINYDGIIYPSVQSSNDAINVVLFHKAAKVETIPLPKGTTVEAFDESYDEDGQYVSYGVIEKQPFKRKKDLETLEDVESVDSRKNSLRVDIKNINVHEIKAVTYESDVHSVPRHRIKKRKTTRNKTFDF